MREPANDIPEAKQVPILLSAPTPSRTMKSRRQHFEPKRAERFHFYKRDQSVGESVAEFDAVLATHCDFFDQALRDRFVARDSIG